MNNRDRYKKAFSVLHTEREFHLEEAETMKRKLNLKPYITAAAVCLLAVGTTAAYAADAGGIRSSVEAWLFGRQTEVEVTELEPGNYSFEFEKDGETVKTGGGGVAYDEFGNEVWLSAEEVLEQQASGLDISSGRVYVYDHELKFDITDLITGPDICVAITRDGKTYWYDIEFSDGFDVNNPDTWESYSLKTSDKKPADAEKYTVLN